MDVGLVEEVVEVEAMDALGGREGDKLGRVAGGVASVWESRTLAIPEGAWPVTRLRSSLGIESLDAVDSCFCWSHVL